MATVASKVFEPPAGPPPDFVTETFDPPPDPPPMPDSHPALPSLALPFCHPADAAHFYLRGWAPLDLSKLDDPRIQRGYSIDRSTIALLEEMFDASNEFFASPDSYKKDFFCTSASPSASSEYGYSNIPHLKSLLTIRTRANIPPNVALSAVEIWVRLGNAMAYALQEIAEGLGLKRDVFDGMVRPCVDGLPQGSVEETSDGRKEDGAVATLLRMFRYHRTLTDSSTIPAGIPGRSTTVTFNHLNQPDESNVPSDTAPSTNPPLAPQREHPAFAVPPDYRLVADPHKDGGLLTIVVGTSPGLEVLDPVYGVWVPIEDTRYQFPLPPGLTTRTKTRFTATLLSGTCLTRLTNGVYRDGLHRVVVPSAPSDLPADEDPNDHDPTLSPYRFSLVLALRAHHPVPIFQIRDFTSPLTVSGMGFQDKWKLPEGITAGEMYDRITKTRRNINAGTGKAARAVKARETEASMMG